MLQALTVQKAVMPLPWGGRLSDEWQWCVQLGLTVIEMQQREDMLSVVMRLKWRDKVRLNL